MSLVEWLKGLTERMPGAGEARREDPWPGQVRAPRKGGEAYAKEWVKVLEESAPNRDPFNTYTWELKPEATRGAPPAARSRSAGKTGATPIPSIPIPGSSTSATRAEDPWGLKRERRAAPKPEQKDGVNPYDTGVFDASWTGRFDKR